MNRARNASESTGMSDEQTLLFRRATPDEAPALHALTGRSALHWGYEPEFLDWEPEALAVTPAFISDSVVYVLEEHGHIAGYYALCGQPPEMSLDKLFVEPDRISGGYGKRLWLHAIETARSLGVSRLHWASDPNAAPFYRAMGATWLREEPTSRPGWNLQMFEYAVGSPEPAAS
jgi:GNAT superfamily N-acetyltransferase